MGTTTPYINDFLEEDLTISHWVIAVHTALIIIGGEH